MFLTFETKGLKEQARQKILNINDYKNIEYK